VQAKARLLAANKKAAGAKKAVAPAALAEAKARKAKLSKQKDTRNFNQVCDAMAFFNLPGGEMLRWATTHRGADAVCCLLLVWTAHCDCFAWGHITPLRVHSAQHI
jgi:hypothetical protein